MAVLYINEYVSTYLRVDCSHFKRLHINLNCCTALMHLLPPTCAPVLAGLVNHMRCTGTCLTALHYSVRCQSVVGTCDFLQRPERQSAFMHDAMEGGLGDKHDMQGSILGDESTARQIKSAMLCKVHSKPVDVLLRNEKSPSCFVGRCTKNTLLESSPSVPFM